MSSAEHAAMVRAHRESWPDDVPYGKCCCQCGGDAPLAPRNNRARGWVKGEPLRYIRGHGRRLPPPVPPNPSGLCECGCGQSAPIATQTNAKLGVVKGHPRRFVHGHGNEKPREYDVDENGCRTVRGEPDRRPVVGINGERMYLSRYVYEEEHGPIPDGFHVHHTCENPLCVNPEHLEALSPEEHAERHPQMAAALLASVGSA